jgi:hypothetical protein
VIDRTGFGIHPIHPPKANHALIYPVCPPREGDLVRRRPAESWHTGRGRDRSRIWADIPSIPVAVRIIVSPLRCRRNKRRPDGCLRERKPRISTSRRWNVFADLPSLPVDQGPVGYDRPGGYSSFIRICRASRTRCAITAPAKVWSSGVTRCAKEYPRCEPRQNLSYNIPPGQATQG